MSRMDIIAENSFHASNKQPSVAHKTPSIGDHVPLWDSTLYDKIDYQV